MESLTIGKLHGLAKCATSMGAIAVLALGHRNNLRRALNPTHLNWFLMTTLAREQINADFLIYQENCRI
jgi:hypothetical protein